ncbi:MAG: reverse transcriptase family protein, partial [Candidatus Thiodiazotropha sp.]
RGKSEDIFGLSIESIYHAGEDFIIFLHGLIQRIFAIKHIPDILKSSLLTPIYKNKGNKNDSKNYRGIAVVSVLMKIIEFILKKDLKESVLKHQSPLQRGFTENASPLNCAIIVDEVIREGKDRGKPVYMAMLDAKSAFDVVVKDILMRKTFHCGVEPAVWTLIDELHTNTKCVIKWMDQKSSEFEIYQGVKQGGLLSADLYKVYVNDLLGMFTESELGIRIGSLTLNAVACADDIALFADDPADLQILLNYAYHYSNLHRYLLQPQKSVILPILWNARCKMKIDCTWTLGQETMPIVDKTSHLGIIRSTSIENTERETVAQNISKARKASYGLMSAGFHGENGLDSITCVNLYKTFILPILNYGLEVILPSQSGIKKLEQFQKQLLKRILSVPQNTPDTAIYILSGIIPIQEQIELKALTLFNNICRQDCFSVERQLAIRQLTVKETGSVSWFINLRDILFKYELPPPLKLLENPPEKLQWKRTIKTAVYEYCKKQVQLDIPLYISLKYFTAADYTPGFCHSILNVRGDPVREAQKLSVKLRLLTDTYILQSKKVKYYESEKSSLCKLCNESIEDQEHFLLKCEILDPVRIRILDCIAQLMQESTGKSFYSETSEYKLKIILNLNSASVSDLLSKEEQESIEFHSRRLCSALHVERFKILQGKGFTMMK